MELLQVIKSEMVEKIINDLKAMLALGGWKVTFTSSYYGGIKTFEINISKEM